VSAYESRVNVAVTLFATSTVTVQAPVPTHAPDQPPNVEVASGVAVIVIVLPPSYVAEQVDPQLIPAGADVTVPPPVPAFDTERTNVALSKRASTLLAASIETMHVPVPAQAPDQPANVEPEDGVAVRNTSVPEGYPSAQSPPQAMPAGMDATVPLPAPLFVTESAYVTATKAAATSRGPDIVTSHVEVAPVHAPDQPANVAPASGNAVSVTAVPASSCAEQEAPQ